MFVDTYTVGMLDTNCYLVGSVEEGEAVIIDPGFNTDIEGQNLMKAADQNDLQIKYIVNTHGHPDHTSGNGFIKKATGASILVHEHDAPMLSEGGRNLAVLFGFSIAPSSPDRLLHDGDIIEVGSVRLKVIYTPGHSKGSISLLSNGVVFTGDALFAGSIGRYDLPGGSYKELMDSIKNKLAVLPDQTKVYPGHGPASTIGEEKMTNPFL